MLDEQFFNNGNLQTYFQENYIVIHAVRERNLAHKETPRDELFDNFDVGVTPTILVATTDGTEIDRLVGYDSPPEEFKERLEGQYRSENSLFNLREMYSKRPDDVVVLAKLAIKCQSNYQFDKMAEFGAKVLTNPAAAKRETLTYDDEQNVSVYEYARLTSIYTDPQNVISFVAEFPQSELRQTAFYYLSRMARNPEHQESVEKAYEELFKKYPEDPSLLQPYIINSARSETNLKRALKLVEVLYRNDPKISDNRLAQSYAKLLIMEDQDEKALRVYGEEYAEKLEKGSDADALNGYAWFWAMEEMNLKSAHAAALKSIELEDLANTWDTLSMVLWKMGKHQEAIEAEEKAIELVGGENTEFAKRIEEIKADMKK